jgi:hypothetical protein
MKSSSYANLSGQHPSSNLNARMEGRDKLRTFTLLYKLLAECILMGGGWDYLCDLYETSTLVSQPHFEASVRMRLLVWSLWNIHTSVTTPLWGKCEDETHTPKSGNLESFGTPANLELNNRAKNTSPRSVLYTVGKALKCRCRKWPRMSHLDICSTSYGQKKGRESNYQFDSRPQKVKNRPNPSACR